MKSYKIQVKHDQGEQGFLIRADSIQEAKEIVMRLEGCPERAILYWSVVPTKRQIERTKNMLRGL